MDYNFPALYFEATRLCNLQCPMCMTGSNDAGKVRTSTPKQLNFEEIRELVLEPGKRLGVIAVGWSGGEFLLRKDAMDLLSLATELGLQSKICSNGELLTRDRLTDLKAATNGNLTISLGLNSMDEHNEWSRDAGPDRTIEVLELCKELKIDRHVIVTISKDNTETFKDTIDYLVRNRISYNRSPYVARGSGCSLFHQFAFDRDDLRDKFHPSLRRAVNGYVSYTPFFLSPELHAQVSGGARNVTVPQNPPIGCWVGTWLAVNAEGDVPVCPVLLDSLSAGNVRDKPLDRLVAESELFAKILDRSQLKGRCGECRYQYTCGGCRAMAYYHTGDYLGEDPTCFFDPADRETVSEHEAETNRLFKKYLIVARYVGLYHRPA
jgi:radical SAM protein with 4Fe4S-binding SPASM domain